MRSFECIGEHYVAQCTVQCFSKTIKINDKGIQNLKIFKIDYITENYNPSYSKEILKRKKKAQLKCRIKRIYPGAFLFFPKTPGNTTQNCKLSFATKYCEVSVYQAKILL